MSREERSQFERNGYPPATIERNYPYEDVAEAVKQIAEIFDAATFKSRMGFTKLAGDPRDVRSNVGVFDVYGYYWAVA